MPKQRNIIYLVIYVAALIMLRWAVNRVFPALPQSADDLWFESGLLLVVLGALVTEKYFTRPLDVVVNAVTVIIVLDTVDVANQFPLFSEVYVYAVLMGALALLGFYLSDERGNPGSLRQQLAHALYRVTAFLGSSRVLFSVVFVFSVFQYFLVNTRTGQLLTREELLILLMIACWASALLIEPFDRSVVVPIVRRLRSPGIQRLGHVVRRQEPNMIIVNKSREVPTPAFGALAVIHEETAVGLKGMVAMYLGDVDTDEGRFLQFYSLGGRETGTMPGTVVTMTTEADGLALLAQDQSARETYDSRATPSR